MDLDLLCDLKFNFWGILNIYRQGKKKDEKGKNVLTFSILSFITLRGFYSVDLNDFNANEDSLSDLVPRTSKY